MHVLVVCLSGLHMAVACCGEEYRLDYDQHFKQITHSQKVFDLRSASRPSGITEGSTKKQIGGGDCLMWGTPSSFPA